MKTAEAFHMGYRAGACGFFYDGMEMIAALAPELGGVEALRGAFGLLFAERDRVNAHMAWTAELCSRAFRVSVSPPDGVDAYRALLREGVFEIVNRWSYIEDIKTVTRLQAWFYCGFGLGRCETVYKGVALMARLVDIAGTVSPVDQMPGNLVRMAQEAGKQIDIASDEDDFSAQRPLLKAVAADIQATAIWLQGELTTLRPEALDADRLARVADAERKLSLDVARIGA